MTANAPTWSSMLNQMLAPKIVLATRSPLAEGLACPKCRWVGKDPEEGWRKYVWVDPGTAERFNIRDEYGAALGECLMVTCERCNY